MPSGAGVRADHAAPCTATNRAAVLLIETDSISLIGPSFGQDITIAPFNSAGQRVIGRGMFEPTDHGGFRRHPLPANLAARKLSALKELVHRVPRYGEEGCGHAYVENLRKAGGSRLFGWLFRSGRGRHGGFIIRVSAGLPGVADASSPVKNFQ